MKLKKGLTFVQLIIGIVCEFLVFIDGMVIWLWWTWQQSVDDITHRREMSMHNLMTVQLEGIHMFLFWAFFVSVLFCTAYYVISLFYEKIESKIKNGTILSVISTVLFILLCVLGRNHHDSYLYNGVTYQNGIELGFLAYLEILLLLFLSGIELYKKFKCKQSLTE